MKEQSINSSKPRERQSRNNRTSSYSNKRYSKRGGDRSPQRTKPNLDIDKRREKILQSSSDLTTKGQNDFNKNNSQINSSHTDNRKKLDKNSEYKKNKSAKRNKREFQSIDDIKSDISRIEKEIYLEIAEFRNITLD